MSVDWSTLSDGDLAALSIAGRQPAFAEILRRHRAAVFRIARAWTGDADEALDIVQETFVAAHRALARYDGARAMPAWLSTIALNKCRDWARRRAVRRFLSFGLDHDGQAEAIPDPAAAIDDRAADRQELDRVTRMIATLPDNLKTPLILHGIEGLPQAEVAALLGISVKAVETRIHRARAALAEKLRTPQGDGDARA
ncbi:MULTISPECIES: RNA polymerase sigma factor [unclassified Sphingomonas]|uniref:RNA polymerase sigma factor n=1 Tax=unclassified Sphingomonas TaxID=196159 RepID=UPI0006F45095|nr:MULTISPECIES: RNA polymerase sigma factor [unclassified Sphingomonas]KQM23894.1 RNA polymerase subunit sigma-24 [Sphingomonas sp. Leaf9]KQM42022.1 RNA polymerase subunit sigma-24 [Sphingomonas sp. Leaf11]